MDSLAKTDKGVQVKALKEEYFAQLETLQELFVDWSEEDLLFTLQETRGDLELAIARISEGFASQWDEVGKPRERKEAAQRHRSNANRPTTAPNARDAPTTSSREFSSARGKPRGRGRGGATSRPMRSHSSTWRADDVKKWSSSESTNKSAKPQNSDFASNWKESTWDSRPESQAAEWQMLATDPNNFASQQMPAESSPQKKDGAGSLSEGWAEDSGEEDRPWANLPLDPKESPAAPAPIEPPLPQSPEVGANFSANEATGDVGADPNPAAPSRDPANDALSSSSARTRSFRRILNQKEPVVMPVCPGPPRRLDLQFGSLSVGEPQDRHSTLRFGSVEIKVRQPDEKPSESAVDSFMGNPSRRSNVSPRTMDSSFSITTMHISSEPATNLGNPVEKLTVGNPLPYESSRKEKSLANSQERPNFELSSYQASSAATSSTLTTESLKGVSLPGPPGVVPPRDARVAFVDKMPQQNTPAMPFYSPTSAGQQGPPHAYPNMNGVPYYQYYYMPSHYPTQSFQLGYGQPYVGKTVYPMYSNHHQTASKHTLTGGGSYHHGGVEENNYSAGESAVQGNELHRGFANQQHPLPPHLAYGSRLGQPQGPASFGSSQYRGSYNVEKPHAGPGNDAAFSAHALDGNVQDSLAQPTAGSMHVNHQSLYYPLGQPSPQAMFAEYTQMSQHHGQTPASQQGNMAPRGYWDSNRG